MRRIARMPGLVLVRSDLRTSNIGKVAGMSFFFVEEIELGVDVHGEDSVRLELFEFAESFVGAAPLAGSGF